MESQRDIRHNAESEQHLNNIFFLIFCILILPVSAFEFGVGDSPTVERSVIHTVVGPNEVFIVYIDVWIPQGYDHYSYDIDEYVPIGWTIIDRGLASQNGQTLSWNYDDVTPAESVGYEYTVQAPPTGSDVFDGIFQFDTMNLSENIYGDSQISVGACSGGDKRSCTTVNGCEGEEECYNGYWGACVATESFCDTDCDGSQECTQGSCAQCECTGIETQSCLTILGCQGEQTCTNGYFGQCVSIENFCDLDCDSIQECTQQACPQCSCNGTQTQGCITSNGCAGEQYCVDGVFGSCQPIQNFCDLDCDGSQECTDQSCQPCSCTGSESQSCLTSNNCQGTQTCDHGEFGSCVATQNYCDLNCDGTSECTDLTCPACGCIENWVCTSYGDCADGKQTRSCTDHNSCGTEDNKPDLEKSCSAGGGGGAGGGSGGSGGAPMPTECDEDWECTAWNDCGQDGLKFRSCSDKNACGTTVNKPFDMDTCTYLGTCSDGLMNADEEGIDCGGRCTTACAGIPEDKKTELVIVAPTIEAEILDSLQYEVIVRNVGSRVADNIKIILNKWVQPTQEVHSITPGNEKRVIFDLKLPADASQENVVVQVLYGDSPLATKIVNVNLAVPKHALKIIIKGDQIVPVLLIDNRELEPRTVDVRYSINKDGNTELEKDIKDLNIPADSIYHEVKEPLVLTDGLYDLVSVFYQEGKQIDVYHLQFRVGEEPDAQSTWYYYLIIPAVVLLSLVFFWYKRKR